MAVVLTAIAVLVPLALAPGLLFYFDVTPKILVLVLGAAAAFVWYGTRGEEFTPLTRHTLGRWYGALMAASVASLCLSTLLSENRALSMTGTNWRRFGGITQAAVLIVAWLAASWFAALPARIRGLLRGATVATALVAAYAVSQYFGFDPILPAQVYEVGEGVWSIVRPPSTLGHAGYFAGWMSFAVFWCAALAWTDPSRPWRVLTISAALLGAAAVVLSGTRAGILGLLAGAVVLVAARRPRITFRGAAAAALVALCALAFYWSPPGQKLRSRTRWYVEDPFGGARLLLWRDTAAMSAPRALAGYGPETFSSVFPRFQSRALARAYPDFYHESPHNIFADALAAQGVPGPALLAGVLVLGLAAARRARGPLAAALAASLVAGAACHQFTSFVAPTALYFHLTVALLLASAIAHAPEPRRFGRWAAAGALAVAGVLAFFAFRLGMADYRLEQARRAIDRGQVIEAGVRYADARRWQLPGAGSDLWYSRSMSGAAGKLRNPILRLQAMRQAGEAALRATATAEDRQNAWYNLAGLYALQNDAARTEQSLRAAIASAPNWFKPHWVLAQALALAGRAGEAESEAALAGELDAGKDSEVGRTLDQIRAVRQRTHADFQR